LQSIEVGLATRIQYDRFSVDPRAVGGNASSATRGRGMRSVQSCPLRVISLTSPRSRRASIR
jgi:hypothetical protein